MGEGGGDDGDDNDHYDRNELIKKYSHRLAYRSF